MTRDRLLTAATLLLLVLLTSQDSIALDWTAEQVRAILADRIDKHEKSVGIAVGLIDETGSLVVGHGKLSQSDPRQPDGHTVFEIGSVSKVFTAILLADMVRRGEVRLEDSVQKLLPDSVRVPREGETEITLYHLTTHTSGLPRMPTNFSPADPSNPYADYTVKQMYEFLGDSKLNSKPGQQASYSNLGVGLLGHVLALRAAADYETLVRQRIAQPLGMKDTVITLTPELNKRLARGHNGALQPASNWDIPTLAGAGALRSTVDDMLAFLAANLGLKKSPLLPAMQDSHRGRERMSGMEIGLGWIIRKGHDRTIRWHNGGTGGYHSFAGMDKDRGVGVVVLSNCTHDIDDIGFHLLQPQFALARFNGAKEAVTIDPNLFDAYVGRYQLTPKFILTVSRDGARYFVQATGQRKFEVFPESETKFFATVVQAAISFHRGEDGTVSHLILHQGGAEQRAGRITETAGADSADKD